MKRVLLLLATGVIMAALVALPGPVFAQEAGGEGGCIELPEGTLCGGGGGLNCTPPDAQNAGCFKGGGGHGGTLIPPGGAGGSQVTDETGTGYATGGHSADPASDTPGSGGYCTITNFEYECTPAND